jgi:hypothetical protein
VVRDYLVTNSNLPGRRGNLELAHAFADVLAASPESYNQSWDLCLDLTSLSAKMAPVDSSTEFLPFCGTLGVGALGAVESACYEEALVMLRKLASDPRWRLREAVAQGLQRLLAVEPRETCAALANWAVEGDLWEMRAVAAAVAEPALLADKELAQDALALHSTIVEQVRQVADRRSDAFRILRKGLAYTVSVVVAALPADGFEWMSDLVDIEDRDLTWVVKQNLKKNRLVKRFPGQVTEILNRIE